MRGLETSRRRHAPVFACHTYCPFLGLRQVQIPFNHEIALPKLHAGHAVVKLCICYRPRQYSTRPLCRPGNTGLRPRASGGGARDLGRRDSVVHSLCHWLMGICKAHCECPTPPYLLLACKLHTHMQLRMPVEQYESVQKDQSEF